MEYFLDAIASSIYREFGNTLNRHCIVFPNRRAGLFFKKYLAGHIDKPVWEPEILTINELFRQHSHLQVAGNEMLLMELYKVYRQLKKPAETFDNFIYWGDIILNDFDDVDKYIVDSESLFRNIRDLKLIDSEFGSLSEEQKEVVRTFWTNFNPAKPTAEKDGFINIWTVLNGIYNEFRKVLRDLNLAYEGMIFRDLAEDDRELFSAGSRWDKIHFIGFNALNECEKRVMLRLKSKNLARFYWDYDESYINVSGYNSAGYFLRDNVRIYGNDMPETWSYRTLLSEENKTVKRRLIDTSSDISQVKLIPEILAEFHDITKENAHETAIVLADENLLIPALTSIPQENGDVNITMGYPFSRTRVYSLVKKLMELQMNSSVSDNENYFRYSDVEALLRDDLILSVLADDAEAFPKEEGKIKNDKVSEKIICKSEFRKVIFSRKVTPIDMSEYFRNILTMVASAGIKVTEYEEDTPGFDKITNEFIYRAVLTINRLETIIKSGDVVLSERTYLVILDRMLRKQSVPFAGEPLSGIQIMGILETRALDFRNLIMLSVNEGILPAISSPSSSYIPFNLRGAFGLPSVNHQESVYAYHFYRLLHRASDVVFVYNSNPDGLRSGELSRFLTQMMYEPSLVPVISKINTEIRTNGSISDQIPKSVEYIDLLKNQFVNSASSKALSPSAINMWLNCRMKFFYRYVNGLKEPEELKDEIDAAMLGEILHEVMYFIYSGFEGKTIMKEFLSELIRDKGKIINYINTSLSKKLGKEERDLIYGNEIIVSDVIFTYVQRILKADYEFAPFTVSGLEKRVLFSLDVPHCDGMISVRTGGVIDRTDSVAGKNRVVDYKTGSVSESIGSISDLFEDDRKKEHDGWLQTLLYCESLFRSNVNGTIRPSIYKIKKAGEGILNDRLRIKSDRKNEMTVESYSEIRDEFITGLKNTVYKIFSIEEPFRMTGDINQKCRYCCYKKLCLR
jgi:hypothetical protein